MAENDVTRDMDGLIKCPRPQWRAEGWWVSTAKGQFKARTPEQAARLVKAYNMHDRLVARVALAVAGCPLALHDGCDGDKCPQSKGCKDYQLLKEARGEK